MARVGVLECIRQPLLDDPVGGEVDRPGNRDAVAVEVKPHRQPGAADLVQQRVEAVESRLRRQLEVVAAPSHRAEEAAHLGERVATGALDAAERLAVLLELVRAACAGRLLPAAP